MTTFRTGQDVAVVEHDGAGHPMQGGSIFCLTVTDVLACSVSARFGDGNEWYFLIDSKGRPWRESGRWRLVPLCTRCERPVTGTPHAVPSDPLNRLYCDRECADADAEAGYEQHYPSGVAT